MQQYHQNPKLLVAKYRPKTLDEFFLNNSTTTSSAAISSSKHLCGQQLMIQTLLDIDDLNILFIGNPSSGKTTLLNLLIRAYYQVPIEKMSLSHLENNILFINNLKEQGISYFRGEMKTFCQASSTIYGKKKMVVIDDVDCMNEQNQQVFRNYIDKYKHNIHFVAVCTNIQKVIESFQSRMHIIKLESPNKTQLSHLYDRVVSEEKLEIDAASRAFIHQYCMGSLRNMLNHLEKISILSRPITIDVCMKLCTDISFQQFETYIQFIRAKTGRRIGDAIKLLYDIYDYGYSVVDIYDYLFTFVKGTEHLSEEEKYRMIRLLCEYITIFHTVHEDPIELAMFTMKLDDMLNTDNIPIPTVK